MSYLRPHHFIGSATHTKDNQGVTITQLAINLN